MSVTVYYIEYTDQDIVFYINLFINISHYDKWKKNKWNKIYKI